MIYKGEVAFETAAVSGKEVVFILGEGRESSCDHSGGCGDDILLEDAGACATYNLLVKWEGLCIAHISWQVPRWAVLCLTIISEILRSSFSLSSFNNFKAAIHVIKPTI
jgi:hypothetical protein